MPARQQEKNRDLGLVWMMVQVYSLVKNKFICVLYVCIICL